MAVAAAIGVGSNLSANDTEPLQPVADFGNRIGQKSKVKRQIKAIMPSSSPTEVTMSGSGSHVGEINRSIEKMTLGNQTPVQPSTINDKTDQHYRRDSNWTSSTEGYGSMKSDGTQVASRRESELSQVRSTYTYFKKTQITLPIISQNSNFSNHTKKGWHESSSSSGLKKSPPAGITQQLDRLHRKAQTASPFPSGISSSGRQSVMSDCTTEMSGTLAGAGSNQACYGQPRRASDPVRSSLDRPIMNPNQVVRQRSSSFVAGGTSQQQVS